MTSDDVTGGLGGRGWEGGRGREVRGSGCRVAYCRPNRGIGRRRRRDRGWEPGTVGRGPGGRGGARGPGGPGARGARDGPCRPGARVRWGRGLRRPGPWPRLRRGVIGRADRACRSRASAIQNGNTTI